MWGQHACLGRSTSTAMQSAVNLPRQHSARTYPWLGVDITSTTTSCCWILLASETCVVPPLLLQANDFERYRELMQQEQGAAAGEKFEVISKFLKDTEDYLHRLAEKVASVKLSQEASEASARATADARSQVSPK